MNKPQRRILLVDDEPAVLTALSRCLRHRFGDVVTCSSGEAALEYVASKTIDLVISDQRMPGMPGIELLEEIRKHQPAVQKILLSAYHDFEDVAEAFNDRTIDRFMTKPWDNQELRFVVSELLGQAGTAANDAGIADSFYGIIGRHETMLELYSKIKKLASSTIPVFIYGETGTGKELVARACHKAGCRSDKPFVAVNCANLTDSLIESQLFGHRKGAFTGADSDQEGFFAAANGGVLFLDEVTTLPLGLQAKLLRAIQEREYTPVGEQQPRSLDVHLLTASSTALQDAVAAGDFREDLYYRLNVLKLDVPALRHRGDDVLCIALHYLSHYAAAAGKQFSGFSDGAENLINSYPWAGNIRQLENTVHALVVMHDGPTIERGALQSLLPDDVAVNATNKAQSATEVVPLWLIEKNAIEQAIEANEGNVALAAAQLEVSASTLYRKMKRWEQ